MPCQVSGDAEIEAGIEDVEVSVDQEQEEIDQENDADQDGASYATAYADYVDVDLNGVLEAGGTGIEASSEADARADLEQVVAQNNANTQTATTTATFTASPTFNNVAVVGGDRPISKLGLRTSRLRLIRIRRRSTSRTSSSNMVWLRPTDTRSM